MIPQQPFTALLDDVYKAVSCYVHIFDPQHADETYLKFLIKPTSPEARAWMSASAIEANAHDCYEDFRHIVPRNEYNTALCGQRHQSIDQTINRLLTPDYQDIQKPSATTVAVGLCIVHQRADESTDFLDLHVAVATEFEEIAQTAITKSIEAAERFFDGTEYRITKIT